MPRAPKPRPTTPVTPAQMFGAELAYWRNLRELSIQDLAAASERNRRTITGAEDGRDIPSEALVNRLDEILDAGGMLLSRYDALEAEKRNRRLNRGAVPRGVSPLASESDASSFVDDTIPDGTLMDPGQRFEKSWTIRNTGDTIWEARLLSRVGIASGVGLITTPTAVPIDLTEPGNEVTIRVPCVAQHLQGTSRAFFKMTDQDGRLFFPDRYYPGLQVQVTVP